MRDKVRNTDDAYVLGAEIVRKDLDNLERSFRRVVKFQAAAPNKLDMLGRPLAGDTAVREHVVRAQGRVGVEAEGGCQHLVDVAAFEGGAGLGLEKLLRVKREFLDRHDGPFLIPHRFGSGARV